MRKKTFKVIRVLWQDIVSSTNERQNQKEIKAYNYTFGILFKKFKIENRKIWRIFTNFCFDPKSETNDFIDIPEGCILEVKILDKVKMSVYNKNRGKDV